MVIAEKFRELKDSGLCTLVEFSSGIDGRIVGTDLFFLIRGNSITWWDNRTGKDYATFEEALDSLDYIVQTDLLFHLDVFRGF